MKKEIEKGVRFIFRRSNAILSINGDTENKSDTFFCLTPFSAITPN
jgi:hypothetical protein